jgi:phytoene synthase
MARTVTPGLCDALAELRALARHHHDCALRAAPQMNASARAALMPLAVVPIYLKRMEKGGYEPFQTLITAPLWRRLYALWSLSRRL